MPGQMTGHSRRRAVLVLASKALAVGAVYFLGARLGLRFALIQKNVTPLWPPTGIAVVAFLLVGRGVWPGVFVAAMLVNLPITPSLWAATAIAAGNTLAPFVAAELLRLAGFRRQMDRLRDAVAIVAAALLGMLISATAGAWTLVAAHVIPRTRFASAWAVWWTGDAMGVLVVAPFLFSLTQGRRGGPASWTRRIEAAVLFVALAAVSVVVAHSSHPLLFLTLPVLGWVAWRFQQRGTAPAVLLVAAIVTWGADHGWGPFAGRTLFGTMLTMQAFNATAALTSFFLAALVTQRTQAREALQRLAAELEQRVRRRTSELVQRGQQLAVAQQIARVGSWEWLIEEDRVTWSDEMYRIHGYRPHEFSVTFEKAVELVVPGDVERIRRNVRAALGSAKDRTLPPSEYRIVRPDGAERVLVGNARLYMGPEGRPARMVGTVQDVTDQRQAEREHQIAETLQRSLLPDHTPAVPGVGLAARYVPATRDVEVGGDWYDAVPLPDGRLGIAIGDVAGHGLRAASIMGQLRMALRAYAVEDDSAATVVARLNRLVRTLGLPDMATLIYLVFDPDSCRAEYANAGHPPPLLIGPRGEGRYLEEGLGPPLGAVAHPEEAGASAALEPGSTLLLFTDGLIERRGVSLREGMAELRQVAEGVAGQELEGACDHLLATLARDDVGDDVALLALRPVPLGAGPLRFRLPAEPRSLAPLRHALRRWLREMGADDGEAYQILVACGEACANAIQHPYGARAGTLEVTLAGAGGEIEVTVADSGVWREASPPGGGHGMRLIEGFMDRVDVARGAEGTMVTMRRRLRAEPDGERTGAR